MKRVSIKEVARQAGVAVGTVSNVLNNPERVHPATRQRVNDTIRDLDYVRNESARHLRAGRSRSIGLIVLDITNPFFTDVARGAEDAADASDVSLTLCNSDGDHNKELRYLKMLAEQRVLGVLIVPVIGSKQSFPGYDNRETPLVIVDVQAKAKDRCSVAVDDVQGGRLAIEHLLRQGHRHIVFVGGEGRVVQLEGRLKGARLALELGPPGAELLTLKIDTLSVAGGRDAGQQILAIPKRQRPTAAFCGNDLLALGLLQTLTSAGVRVPDDFAIVGYGDIEFADAAAVPLSSVRQARHRIGYEATRLLLDEASNELHQHEHLVIAPELIVRRSSDFGVAAKRLR